MDVELTDGHGAVTLFHLLVEYMLLGRLLFTVRLETIARIKNNRIFICMEVERVIYDIHICFLMFVENIIC